MREKRFYSKTSWNPTAKEGHRKEIQRRCKEATRETERKTRNVPREKRFEEDRGAVQSNWSEALQILAVKSLVTSERQFQARERSRQQTAGETFFFL